MRASFRGEVSLNLIICHGYNVITSRAIEFRTTTSLKTGNNSSSGI